MSKLALGSAQFGMDYGINNKRGIIPESEVFDILDMASSSGVDTIDTAGAYGKSEEILGKYFGSKGCNFKIISKLPKIRSVAEMGDDLERTLDELGARNIYGYLVHDYASFKRAHNAWDRLAAFKEDGKASKVGFSIYYPHELDDILARGYEFDLVQLPYNVFDQRFTGYLPTLKLLGVEVHTRSAFMQGLVFMDPSGLKGDLSLIKDKLILLRKLSEETGRSVLSLCLNFVSSNTNIDKVVFGVDSISNLKEVILASKEGLEEKIHAALITLREDNEDVILPMNWNKGKAAAK